jgi:hypothetical protein
MLRELKDAALKIRLVLKPEEVIIDFERGAINAFVFHWPCIRIIGCFFHLDSNFYKKICNIGLKTNYDEDESLRNWVKKFTGLALVPIDKVEELFCELCEQKDEWIDTPVYDQIEEFAGYV